VPTHNAFQGFVMNVAKAIERAYRKLEMHMAAKSEGLQSNT
jgi:hypothetical protein